MDSTCKRTPSRCREWERQRRNKFNEAILQLGEIVKAIINAKDPTVKENVQYPKIEIIQKATFCLNSCAQEQTQLKAEILALQVQLDAEKVKKNNNDASTQVYLEKNTKDASTQVIKGFNRKSKNGKYVKLVMLQKSKRNALKEKLLVTNSTVEPTVLTTKLQYKEPKILPKIKLNDRKEPGNAIVVLPATPYIIPQRPLLLPSIPPALVLVNSNLQALNKPSVLTASRNGDITKTTMVNILPISAYSCPLSAARNKKNNVKLKNNKNKKAQKHKTVSKPNDLGTNKNHNASVNTIDDINREINQRNNEESNNKTKESAQTELQSESVQTTASTCTSNTNHIVDKPDNQNISTLKKINVLDCKTQKPKSTEVPLYINQPNCTESIINEETTSSTTLVKCVNSTVNNEEKEKLSKVLPEKENIPECRDKENKLSNILETNLCDNTVDGGNARLELAEEFLAASPTAAFLMSFPLVSGNRADSPAEEPHNTIQANSKDNNERRNEIPLQPAIYFDKSNNSDLKIKTDKLTTSSTIPSKQTDQQKKIENIPNKGIPSKSSMVPTSNTSIENPFLNLPMPSIISTACTLPDTTFGLDFDCHISKTIPSQATSYVNNNNLFYKGDPFNTVKNTIYSTSSITSSHEYNSLGLYPCAMEKYTSKNKSDYTSVEDNLMKMGPSRLTYDIDLGWSHKSLDFVNCSTTSSTFSKDILTTASAAYSTSYNPFNPEFHVPLVTNANKKENISSKPTSSFAETISNFYSQPNLWTEDVPFYSNNNASKNLANKHHHQNYSSLEQVQPNIHGKQNDIKPHEIKHIVETRGTEIKPSNIHANLQISDKYTKKSPNKMHINWMTSEIRPMQNNCNPIPTQSKEILKSTYAPSAHKTSYNQAENIAKKQDHESNYFPIAMHNFPTQTPHEEFQIWPPARPLGTTEISIDPPPINLPTLVGDLALGPHDKKKNTDAINRILPHTDIQNCGNFLSVTQLMNRSTDNMPSRYQGPNNVLPKTAQTKDSITHFATESHRKIVAPRLENQAPQPCYVYNDPKLVNSYENNMNQFPQAKAKAHNKPEKSSKTQKNSYSAEALIRGASCTQKSHDNTAKFMVPQQKYNDFNTLQDSSVAQVSHFPPILDYSENSYASQQFSGTALYNTTTNTISNSFYSNFMPGTSNIMSSNYGSGPFTGDFIDYTQAAECNFTNHKYEELKIRNNSSVFQQEKAPSNYKSSRRESTAKHKLECSKRESSKKYPSKRSKLNEIEEWNDTSHSLWQNKTSNKRHSTVTAEDLPFPNYVGNQMTTQYQPDFFNSHITPPNVQSVGHNADRSLTTFPATSRANFNLSTIFPEITMKVQ